MAGAFSGHLIDSFYSAHRSPGPGPFGMPFNTSFNNPPSDIITSGAMSFNRSMHGTARPQASMSMFGPDDQSYMDMSEATAIKGLGVVPSSHMPKDGRLSI
jgi:DNA repair and recombination protein RAD52